MNYLAMLLPPGDKRIFFAWMFLLMSSLAMLWSVTEPIQGPYNELDPVVAKGVFYRQAVWAMLGYIGLLVAVRLPLRFLENMAIPAFIFSLILSYQSATNRMKYPQ